MDGNLYTHQIGVPEPDGGPERNLPHQQVVHPAERELEKLDAVLAQVPVQAF